MGGLDDFGELYAGLEDRMIVTVPLEESEAEDKNEIGEKGAGCENWTIESGSSSDSEDDLQIVLNEEDYPNKLPSQLIVEGEEDEGDDLVIVTEADCSGNEPTLAGEELSVDVLLQGNGDKGNTAKGAHRNRSRPYLAGSVVRTWNTLSGRGYWDHLTVPCSLGNASYNLGFPMVFSNGYDFYLPRNRSIFDIDVESFECKPWKFNGVDITDYFNFGLDEEGWRAYCKQLVHFQQNKLPVHGPSKLNKPTGIMSGEVAQHGCDSGPEILNYLDNVRNGIRMPKGRAIQVESGNGDRIPSVDVRRPRNRDSDVVIEITTGLAVEDALDPIISRIALVDDNESKCELLSNSKNDLCKRCEGSSKSCERPHPYTKKRFDEKLNNMDCGRDSSLRDISLSKPDAIIANHYSSSPKSSNHNGSFEAPRDEVCSEKVPSPECIHFYSDSWLQESVLSDCYPSSETGSATSKTDHTICGSDSPQKVVELNLISDDGVASSLVHRQKIDGENQSMESGTIVRQWNDEPDEKGHLHRGGKFLLKKNIKDNNGKEAFLACSKGYDEDPSPVRNRGYKTTAREVNTRRNGCYINGRAHHNSRTRDIVNWDYMQSSSRKMSLYDRRGYCSSRRLDEHDMLIEAHYNALPAKDCHRQRSVDEDREVSFDKYFGTREDESLIDKYDKVPCNAGALRRPQKLDSYGKTLLVDLESSSKYVNNHEDSRLYEGGFPRRIYRDSYAADKRGRHDVPNMNQVPSLFKLDKRCKSHIGHSHTRETFDQLSSKHHMVSSKKCHPFSSRTGFNFDDDKFPTEVRAVFPDNSAYNEIIKSSLALPRLLAKEEVSFRHQGSNNLSSPKRYTLYGTVHHQKGRVDKSSVRRQKIYSNHHYNSCENKLTIRSGKDSESVGHVGSISDNFVRDTHEVEDRGCSKEISEHLSGWKVKTKGRCTSTGGGSLLGADIAAFKESKDSEHNEESSHHNLKTTSNHFYPNSSKKAYSNHGITTANKHPIKEEEIEDLEEGQLVEEESDNHVTTTKMNLTDPIRKSKLVGRYDRNHLLETRAKMEKRRERFKDPIPLKKESENTVNMQADTAIDDEVKQHRPARKRRWGCG